MSILKNNLIIGAFILVAFVGLGVFGLFSLGHADHGIEAPMVDCPYTENGSSFCENTLDHIAGWQQFSNVTLTSLFILYLFVSGIISTEKN